LYSGKSLATHYILIEPVLSAIHDGTAVLSATNL
jgi:hypothetical protein